MQGCGFDRLESHGRAGNAIQTSPGCLVLPVEVGHPGTVDEIAALAAFLASDEASYITGSTHVIDGGLQSV